MIDPKDLIKVNQILEVQKEEDFQNNINKFYPSRVEEIDEACIVIGTPIEQSALIDLKPESNVVLWFNLPLANYAFFCQVKARIYEPLPLTLLQWPHEIKRIQRRAFVRIPLCVRVNFSQGKRDEENQKLFYDAWTNDLSGGGLSFTSPLRLRQNQIIDLVLHLTDHLKVNAEGQVTRIEQLPTKKYFIGLKFINIGEGTRDMIIHYLFIRQRDLIKRGLLE